MENNKPINNEPTVESESTPNKFNQISLRETKIYNTNYSFSKAFKRYNITTLEQIFNDELMYEIMLSCRKKTRQHLQVFISLMKFKYLGVLMPTTELFSQENYEPNLLDLIKLGFNEDDRNDMFNDFCKLEDEFDKNKGQNFECFLKKLAALSNGRRAHIIDLNLQSYHQSKMMLESKSKDEKQIYELKEQLKSLVETRNNLEAQISDILQKIEALSSQERISR